MKPFQPSREDGRSDRTVVFSLMQNAEPNTVFSYDRLQQALSVGTDRAIDRRTVGTAVRAANKKLLSEQRRSIVVIPNVGYRVVEAKEHMTLGLARRDRSEVQLAAGFEVLKQTRIEELDEPERSLHRGQLMIMAALYDAIRTTRKRQDVQDRVIEDLLQRIDKLEQRKPDPDEET